MSDRNSAEIFGMVFRLLASDPTDQHKEWAEKLYEKSRNFDFNDYQMGAFKSLDLLGIQYDRDEDDPDFEDDLDMDTEEGC